jgi:hypothetical protein
MGFLIFTTTPQAACFYVNLTRKWTAVSWLAFLK